MTTDTGGPAFPGNVPLFDAELGEAGGYVHGAEGMTLLDAAALAALPAALESNPLCDKDAVVEAFNTAKEFIAEKRRREE